jgi:tRNA threonylcarbamoyladenosine modification (KEOPS) complex Cgi121 subunit
LNRCNSYFELKLSNFYVSIFCCDKLDLVEGTKLVELTRQRFEAVYMQGFNTEAIFGLQHIIEALKITLEAVKRGIVVAKRPELDLLLRISCTTQISKAISHAGMKSGRGACFVLFSKNKGNLIKARNNALQSLHEYDGLEPIVDTSTRIRLAAKLGFESGSYFLKDDSEFLKYLTERAALITK